jgi:transposase
MREEGLLKDDDDDPTDEELRKFDKQRGKQGKKKVSNDEWASPSDPASRIVKMKDGRTHLGYKAEHVVDLESEVILSAVVYSGTEGDAETLLPSVITAQTHLDQCGCDLEIEEIAADKGYHSNETLANSEELDLRTYIPEPNSPYARRWTDKPPEQQHAVINNRRRMIRVKGKKLQHERSEKVERSFAHVCETGGARRTWLKGLDKINKRYLIVAAARNLGLLMLKLFGIGKPRTLQGFGGGLSCATSLVSALLMSVFGVKKRYRTLMTEYSTNISRFVMTLRTRDNYIAAPASIVFSTGC